MTEKQRWLIRELDAWESQRMERIGRYGPKTPVKESLAVRQARRQIARLQGIIAKWDRAKKIPWQRAADLIHEQARAVKRVILFEKTEAALKALRALPRSTTSG